MLNVFEIDIINYSGRVVSTFGQPNLYSGFLLLTLPWVVLGKKPNWLVFLIIFSGIIVSLSKASVILGVGLGIYLISRKIKSRRVRILLLLVTLLSFLVIGVLLPGGVIREEIIRPLTSNKIEENHIVEKRIYILPVIFRGSLERPFAGFGLDSIDLLYRSQFADFKPEIRDYPPKYFNLMNLAVDRSHNYFLDLFVFAGILGLGFYLYLNYLLLKKPAPIYLKITLVLYLVWVQFQVQSIVHLIFFWLILGLIDKIKKLSDDEF
jgi:O-antigen ligase